MGGGAHDHHGPNPYEFDRIKIQQPKKLPNYSNIQFQRICVLRSGKLYGFGSTSMAIKHLIVGFGLFITARGTFNYILKPIYNNALKPEVTELYEFVKEEWTGEVEKKQLANKRADLKI